MGARLCGGQDAPESVDPRAPVGQTPPAGPLTVAFDLVALGRCGSGVAEERQNGG